MLADKNHKGNQTVSGASVVEEPLQELRVMVCDDEERQLEELGQIFTAVKLPVQLSVDYFAAAETLLRKLQQCRESGSDIPDIIFCDVKMPEMDGIALGRKMREIFPNIYLVLFTAYPEYAIEGYETRAFRYLLKPVTAADIEQVVCHILQEKGRSKKLMVRSGDKEYIESLSNIVYLSSEDKYTVLYSEDNHYVDYMSLNEYERMLEPYGFCRIHRKYLVNLAYHHSMSKGKVTLLDGTELPISRRKEAVCRARLLQMLGEKIVL